MMKFDPHLFKQIIFASSIALLIVIITCSVTLRKYKRRLLQLKITERHLINLIKKSAKAVTIEEIAALKLDFEKLSKEGTYNKDLSIKHAKAVDYLEGKLSCLLKQKAKENKEK